MSKSEVGGLGDKIPRSGGGETSEDKVRVQLQDCLIYYRRCEDMKVIY